MPFLQLPEIRSCYRCRPSDPKKSPGNKHVNMNCTEMRREVCLSSLYLCLLWVIFLYICNLSVHASLSAASSSHPIQHCVQDFFSQTSFPPISTEGNYLLVSHKVAGPIHDRQLSSRKDSQNIHRAWEHNINYTYMLSVFQRLQYFFPESGFT